MNVYYSLTADAKAHREFYNSSSNSNFPSIGTLRVTSTLFIFSIMFSAILNIHFIYGKVNLSLNFTKAFSVYPCASNAANTSSSVNPNAVANSFEVVPTTLILFLKELLKRNLIYLSISSQHPSENASISGVSY